RKTMSEMATNVGKTFVWHECNVPDAEAAKAFYTGLFGWETKDMDMGPMGTYTILENNGMGVGGIMPTVGDMAHVPPHWSVYIATDDVDASAEKATELGAEVMVPAFSIPTVGRMSLIKDPQGAHFWLFKGDPNEGGDCEAGAQAEGEAVEA